jgi:demethylmenaquinone methyltransferase/2-methoxy-6-polyprenyl-1,4-benzoquinol methylase
MSQKLESPPGTRPTGATSEKEAGEQVRQMFSRIAHRYDLANHVLSLEVDRLWRRRLARRYRHILTSPRASALDLCCGTGDLTVALRREGPARVIGVDFAHSMLTRAVAKCATSQTASAVASGGTNRQYIEADALDLPFSDACFDLVATAFGFRNLANYERGLAEIGRVLKPGGILAILEFSEPRSRVFGALYRIYFRRVLPRMGRIISGDGSAYSYLPASVGRFPSVDELVRLMERMGFHDGRFEYWTGGVVVLHTATR